MCTMALKSKNTALKMQMLMMIVSILYSLKPIRMQIFVISDTDSPRVEN